MNSKIFISEIFGPTIQGEGALAGRVTVFVRTGGCDFDCAWCDSMHAVAVANKHKWRPMDTGAVMARVVELSGAPCLVTLSGGNPALQPLADLIDLGRQIKYTFALETQGSIVKPWFHKLAHLILSPKPPSSQMRYRPDRLLACLDAAFVGTPRPNVSLKVVVMHELDYQFARTIYEDVARPYALPFFITPGNHTPPPGARYNAQGAEFDAGGVMARTRWLVERLRADRWYDVSVLPQIHTLVWGNEQGV